MSSERVGPGVA